MAIIEIGGSSGILTKLKKKNATPKIKFLILIFKILVCLMTGSIKCHMKELCFFLINCNIKV